MKWHKQSSSKYLEVIVLNTDKAYIFGLIIGGGVFGNDRDTFYIKLPYKQWGDIVKNPQRAGLIANDILKVVKPIFKSEYNLEVAYEVTPEWRIVCSGDCSFLFDDLKSYNINPNGEIRKSPYIKTIVIKLVDDNMKRRFLAGLADTIGSTTASHRRFSDDIQILSFEIAGFDFEFVCDLCKLLSSIRCYPDQVLWNHPNMHGGKDAYYKSWKKGFKLRVTLDQYSDFGAFAFRTKAESSTENRKKQHKKNVAVHCKDRLVNINDATAVHVDENSLLLPDIIRGGHYIHYKHFCAVLGCENAPYDEIDTCLSCAEKYINPFTILHKGTLSEIKQIINNSVIMKNRNYNDINYSIEELLSIFEKKTNKLLYGNGLVSGYPINTIIDAVTYIIASKTGMLNGKRPKGNRILLLKNFISSNPNTKIILRVPDLLTPLIVVDSDVAALVGPVNPEVYKNLIYYDKCNKYKMLIREITEIDLM